MSNNPEKAIKNLKSVARINGRHEEGDKIDLKVRERSNTSVYKCFVMSKSAAFKILLKSTKV